jgi:CRP-like cAMP-binding protein
MRGHGDFAPTQNHLLAALPGEDLQRIQRSLMSTELDVEDALYDAVNRTQSVYFPTTVVVSLLALTNDGSSTNVALVGSEGLIGVSSFMGGETTHSRLVVQSAGHAYKLSGQVIQNEFMRGGAVQRLLLRYMQALLAQMAQTAVCNRHHALDQRLCRWLLLSLDRVPTNQLRMTQELIANMLGVRREGVTVAAGKLQSAGIIEYRRGNITILDRKALEERACECYAAVESECSRLLPKPAASRLPLSRLTITKPPSFAPAPSHVSARLAKAHRASLALN